MSKTAEVRRLAREYLSQHGTLKRSDFIKHLKSTDFEFTEGHIAAALSALPDQHISRIDTGIYQLNDLSSVVSDSSAQTKTVQSLHEKINSILDESATSLKALANVNYFEVDKDYIKELEKVKDLISKIEALKK